jgi:hypothetical protein
MCIYSCNIMTRMLYYYTLFACDETAAARGGTEQHCAYAPVVMAYSDRPKNVLVVLDGVNPDSLRRDLARPYSQLQP